MEIYTGTAGDPVAIDSGEGARALNNENIIIRYSTFASAEGLLAAREENPSGADASCGNDEQRRMADELHTIFSDFNTSPAPAGGVQQLKCSNIQLGTSDIDPECFTQRTFGPPKWNQFNGSIGTLGEWFSAYTAWEGGDDTNWWERVFSTGNPLPATPWAGMSKANPFVVPFAFFRNNDATTPVPVDNVTKAMAQMLFTGQVLNWNKFVSTVDLPVVLCIRHAGSGTHATLDWAVVRPQLLVQNAQHPEFPDVVNGLSPVVLTNKGSSDNVSCSGFNLGAISYADADKLTAGTGLVECNSSKGENCRIAYQGAAPTRANIVNCSYDFWGANVVYWQDDENSTLLQDLIAFAEDPANMASGHQLFWASQGELVCDRATCKDSIRIKP